MFGKLPSPNLSMRLFKYISMATEGSDRGALSIVIVRKATRGITAKVRRAALVKARSDAAQKGNGFDTKR